MKLWRIETSRGPAWIDKDWIEYVGPDEEDPTKTILIYKSGRGIAFTQNTESLVENLFPFEMARLKKADDKKESMN